MSAMNGDKFRFLKETKSKMQSRFIKFYIFKLKISKLTFDITVGSEITVILLAEIGDFTVKNCRDIQIFRFVPRYSVIRNMWKRKERR